MGCPSNAPKTRVVGCSLGLFRSSHVLELMKVTGEAESTTNLSFLENSGKFTICNIGGISLLGQVQL